MGPGVEVGRRAKGADVAGHLSPSAWCPKDLFGLKLVGGCQVCFCKVKENVGMQQQ